MRKDKTKKIGRTKTAMKGISRIDYPTGTTKGWYVRVYKWRKVYSKLLSDSRYGGKIKGLAAAKIYRKRLLFRVDVAIENYTSGLTSDVEVEL